MAKSGMFGASQGPETKTQTTAQMMSPEQRKYFNQAIDIYGNQLGKTNVYQGQRVAPFGELQNKVFDWANQGGFVTSPEQTANYYRDVIKNPALKNYNEITNPAVKEAYSGPGYWGNARATAETKAGQDLAANLDTQWGKLNWDVAQANKEGALQQFNLGGAQQTQSQNEINAAIQKFAEENQITDPTNLSILMKLLGMDVEQTGVKRQATTEPSWHTGDWAEFGAKTVGSIFGF